MEATAGNSILDFETLFSDFQEFLFLFFLDLFLTTNFSFFGRRRNG